MKMMVMLIALPLTFTAYAHADMDELFREKNAIEAQQQAARKQAQDAKEDREVNAEVENIARVTAAKHGGYATQPTYEYCEIDACRERQLINAIKFTTNDGYECEASRLSLSSTFNGEIHRQLLCIQRGTLKTIHLVKVGSHWETWR